MSEERSPSDITASDVPSSVPGISSWSVKHLRHSPYSCGVHCLAQEEDYTISHQGSQAEKEPTDHPVHCYPVLQVLGTMPALLSLHTSSDGELTPSQVGLFLPLLCNLLLVLLGPVQMSPSFLSIPHHWNKRTSSEGEKLTLCHSSASDLHETGTPPPTSRITVVTSLSSQASCSSSHSTRALPGVPRLTFSVQRSTHLSTDMFGMAAVTGKARERLSGRRKQPRKTALPSGEPEGKGVVRPRLGEPPCDGSTCNEAQRRQESCARSHREAKGRLMS